MVVLHSVLLDATRGKREVLHDTVQEIAERLLIRECNRVGTAQANFTVSPATAELLLRGGRISKLRRTLEERKPQRGSHLHVEGGAVCPSHVLAERSNKETLNG